MAKLMRTFTGSGGHAHGNDKKKSASHQSSLLPAAYLNTMADMVHNFTDGLALGTAWSQGSTMGVSTTIAIFCHEIPHELGDMGILVQSGASKRQALAINSFSACCATA